MIRIFIAALLYLIGLFTQTQDPSKQEVEQIIETKFTEENAVSHAQDNKDSAYASLYISTENFGTKTDFRADKIKAEKDCPAAPLETIGMPLEALQPVHNIKNYGSPRFGNTKFVVSDKELTFEIQ